MDDYGQHYARFEIGRVLNRTFFVLRSNLVAFALAALLIIGLPQFAYYTWPLIYAASTNTASDAVGAAALSLWLPALGTGGFVISGFTQTLLIAALTPLSLATLNDDRISLKVSFRAALSCSMPVLGFIIFAGLGLIFGLLLFIVPGIFFVVIWRVAVPVIIAEDLDMASAFERSASLTSGYRWMTLLFITMIFLIGMAVSIIISIFTASLGSGYPDSFISGEGIDSGFWISNAFVSTLPQLFTAPLAAASTAALYYELRHIKEGLAPKAIASVFD